MKVFSDGKGIMKMSDKKLKPGDKTPTSGQYEVIGLQERIKTER